MCGHYSSNFKTNIMTLKSWLYVSVLGLLVTSCKKDLTGDQAAISPEDPLTAERGNHHLKIAIVSDIHYMDPSLLGPNGATGLAFQNYLNQDPKMVQYSDPIFRNV